MGSWHVLVLFLQPWELASGLGFGATAAPENKAASTLPPKTGPLTGAGSPRHRVLFGRKPYAPSPRLMLHGFTTQHI